MLCLSVLVRKLVLCVSYLYNVIPYGSLLFGYSCLLSVVLDSENNKRMMTTTTTMMMMMIIIIYNTTSTNTEYSSDAIYNSVQYDNNSDTMTLLILVIKHQNGRKSFIALTVKKTPRCNIRSYHKLSPIAIVL